MDSESQTKVRMNSYELRKELRAYIAKLVNEYGVDADLYTESSHLYDCPQYGGLDFLCLYLELDKQGMIIIGNDYNTSIDELKQKIDKYMFFEKIAYLYNNKLSDKIREQLQLLTDNIMQNEEGNVLSYQDILRLIQENNYDFISHDAVPFVKGQNDIYVVYNLKENVYTRLNVATETIIARNKKLSSLLQQNVA